jgi:hypothetical protein
MVTTTFKQNFSAYAQWKARLSHTVEEYRDWLEKQGLLTPEAQQKTGRALKTLQSDRLTIAFVAEFSRGKTELINAIFFADYGRRLLPSSAGRTTMCPTELLWDDERNESYLRLLPIETRVREGSVSDLKKDAQHWVHYPLDVQSPAQMESTLRELIQTKGVSADEAARLGLYSEEQQQDGTAANRDGKVEIPRWRHAVISFPHALLKQGLVILDTPGLNALGSEPELTLSTLPKAQAVLFLLAADTGVTRSDLEIWQHHIKGFQSSRRRGLVVVLNKIDTLWDDLKAEQQIQRVIAQQKSSTAKILGIDENAIFPISAHKGLLAKVKKNQPLLHRSALDDLENFLARDMLRERQEIVLDTVESQVGQLIENNRSLVSQQLHNVKRQLTELEELRDKSDDVIQHLLKKTRDEQGKYLESIARFQTNRGELQNEAKKLRTLLDLAKIEQLMQQTYHDMLHSWTTHGMKKSMKFLFDELRRAMQAITTRSEQTRKMVRLIYQRFQNELGFTNLQPQRISTMKFRVDLELLHQEAEAFRKSPSLAMTEQSYVVKRFYQAMVGRARNIFFELNQTLDEWLSHAMDPLVNQIHEHKEMMEKRLENLQKIGRSKSTLQVRIEDLESQYAELARQLTALRNLYNGIHLSRPMNAETPPRPRLVSQQRA